MFRQTFALSIVGLALALAACTGADSGLAPASPTPAPPTATASKVPTPTPITRATLPPTWTPIPQGPGPMPTVDPFLTLSASTPTDSCRGFGPDGRRSQTTVILGSPVRVYWTPAENATLYEVVLSDSTGRVINIQSTSDTNATIRADLFEGYDQLYGWLVRPYDANRKPVCAPRGSELRTQP